MSDLDTIELVKNIDVDKYKYGFTTDIESEKAPKGLNEEIVGFISRKKGEPDWMLEWRLGAYRRWVAMEEPNWARVRYPKIDFQSIHYYSAPKSFATPKSLDEVDPKLLEMYAKLGIPLKEQEILAGVRRQGEPSDLDEAGGGESGPGKLAIDAVFDSVSVVTTFKDEADALKDQNVWEAVAQRVRNHEMPPSRRRQPTADEAKLLADYGDCGQPVCCGTFLSEMPPVSMKMAKVQKATLDPTKISGRCGRLKCCLRYEYDTYEDLQQELPPIGSDVVTKNGRARILAQEILAQQLLVATEDNRRILIPASDVLTILKTGSGRREGRDDDGGSRRRPAQPPTSGEPSPPTERQSDTQTE